MANSLQTEITLAHFALNGIYTSEGSSPQFGLGDLLQGIYSIASAGAAGVSSFNGRTGAVSPQVGDYNTTLIAEGSNLYFTQARVLATLLTGFSATPGTVTSADTVLSAIGKLVANESNDLHVNGSNYMNGNIGFSPDATYTIGETSTTFRPFAVYSSSILGAGLDGTGTLKLGQVSGGGASIVGSASALTLSANARSVLAFDGLGNITFNANTQLATNPFISFGTDGIAILGGYPSPGVATQVRPGYAAVKYAIGIGTGAGETGTLQLGDYSYGNNLVGTSTGTMTLTLNNKRRWFIDASGNWWLDQDAAGGNPTINFTVDGARDIGQSNITLRPRNVWVANEVGIGLDNLGTLAMGSGGANMVGNSSGTLQFNNGVTQTGIVDTTGDWTFTASVTSPTLKSTAPQTTITGSAGSSVCSQPFQGSSYKKVIIYLNGYTNNGTQTYTFPTAFTHTPVAVYTAAGATPTISTTTVSVSSTTTTGYVILEGF
jgi:hypothetical protein